MNNITRTILFTLFLTSTYASAQDQTETRVSEIIKKSKNTRAAVKTESNSQRDPASLKSNYNEFESLMNDESEQDWLNEVDKLSVE